MPTQPAVLSFPSFCANTNYKHLAQHSTAPHYPIRNRKHRTEVFVRETDRRSPGDPISVHQFHHLGDGYPSARLGQSNIARVITQSNRSWDNLDPNIYTDDADNKHSEVWTVSDPVHRLVMVHMGRPNQTVHMYPAEAWQFIFYSLRPIVGRFSFFTIYVLLCI